MATITRQHPLRSDSHGRYRPYLGFSFDHSSGTYRDHRFNLGRDYKKAELALIRLRQLWEHICALHRSSPDFPKPYWDEHTRWIAAEIIAGNITIVLPRKRKDGAESYAAFFNRVQRHFPFIVFVPEAADIYSEGQERNLREIESRIEQIEIMAVKAGKLPAQRHRLVGVSGTLHEALDAYSNHINATGDRLPNGPLKPYQRLRIARVSRFKVTYPDIRLSILGYDACVEMMSHWRKRPITQKGKTSSRHHARHHMHELYRFFAWLDATEKFDWQEPRGLRSISRRIPKLQSERNVSVVTKHTYSVDQLAIINRHSTQLDRLKLYIGLNCAMGAAEMGRIVISDIALNERHPSADKLHFESTDSDSFLRFSRPKTGVFGEWLLWQPVASFLQWGIERSRRVGSAILLVSEAGRPFYNETSRKRPICISK